MSQAGLSIVQYNDSDSAAYQDATWADSVVLADQSTPISTTALFFVLGYTVGYSSCERAASLSLTRGVKATTLRTEGVCLVRRFS